MSALSNEAKTFLQRLDKALRPIGDQTRKAFVNEIRAHLLDRAAQGNLHLLSCLENMGSPEQLAAELMLDRVDTEFVEDPEHDARSLPTLQRRNYLPSTRTQASRRRLVGQLLVDVKETVVAATDQVWSVRFLLFLLLIPLDCFQFTSAAFGRAFEGRIIQSVGLLLVSIPSLLAFHRAMIGDEGSVWPLDGRGLKMWIALLAVGGFLVLPLLFVAVSGSHIPAVGQPVALASTGALAGIAYILLRAQAWIVSVVSGNGVTFRAGWRCMRPRTTAAAFAAVVLLAPLSFAYLALAAAPTLLANDDLVTLGLLIAVGQAALQTLTVMLIAALNVICFRWVVKERVPRRNRFSDQFPSASELAAVTERMRRNVRDRQTSERLYGKAAVRARACQP